jgi:hypothetical protein
MDAESDHPPSAPLAAPPPRGLRTPPSSRNNFFLNPALSDITRTSGRIRIARVNYRQCRPSMSNLVNCVICGRSRENGFQPYCDWVFEDGPSPVPAQEANCQQCGQYYLLGSLNDYYMADLVDTPKKTALSCATRQASESGKPLRLTRENAAKFAGAHVETRVSDNMDNLLRWIAKRAPRPSSTMTVSIETDFTVVDCLGPNEFQQYLSWLTTNSLVGDSGIPGRGPYFLTLDGWNRLQPPGRPGGKPGQCFIAMWFDPTMDEVELEIANAVEDSGFKRPLRIDKKEHNNQITDELLAAIRDSEFIIADVTEHRPNVYYEAGFAKGLGREVIYCCRKDNFENRHFDVSTINHVVWDDPADLRKKLAARIKGTILPKAILHLPPPQ